MLQMRLRFKPQLHFVALISVKGTFISFFNYEQQKKENLTDAICTDYWVNRMVSAHQLLFKRKCLYRLQRKLHTWSNSMSSLSRSCSKNLSSPWALKMRSDSSEKRTASPSNATLSCVSDTSVSFSGMNMVAAAMPGHKRSQRHKNRFVNI